MLIAVMGDTFSRVKEVQSQVTISERVKILSDYVILVRNSKLDQDKYLFAIEPASIGSGEENSWEGGVSQMRKIIDKNVQQQQKDFNKKLVNLSLHIDSHLSTVNARIDSMISNQQHTPKLDEVENTMRAVLKEFKTQ